MNDYYEKKAKDNEELAACWCWLCVALVAVGVGIAVVKWLSG